MLLYRELPYRDLLYNGKLSRVKTFVNFVVFGLSAKVFPTNFLGMVVRRGILRGIVSVLPIRESFHPRKFSAIPVLSQCYPSAIPVLSQCYLVSYLLVVAFVYASI